MSPGLVAIALIAAASPTTGYATAGWQRARIIDHASAYSSGDGFYDLAVAPSGAAIAAWEQAIPRRDTPTDRVIDAARLSTSGAVGKPQRLSGLDAQLPQVAIDRKGNAVAGWIRNGWIEASFAPSGQRFGPTQRIASGGLTAVGFDPAGNAIVIFGDGVSLMASWAPPGRPFGSPHVVTDSLTGGDSVEALAYDHTGALVLLLNRNDALWLATVARGRPVTDLRQLSAPGMNSIRSFDDPTDPSSENGIGPAELAVLSSGNVTALWVRYTKARSQIETRTLADGQLGPRQVLATAPTESAQYPQGEELGTVYLAGLTLGGMAKIEQDGLLATWFGNHGVRSAIKRAGHRFATPKRISSGATSYLDFTANTRGDAIVLTDSARCKACMAGRAPKGSFGPLRKVSGTLADSTLYLSPGGAALAITFGGPCACGIYSAEARQGRQFGSPHPLATYHTSNDTSKSGADAQGNVLVVFSRLEESLIDRLRVLVYRVR